MIMTVDKKRWRQALGIPLFIGILFIFTGCTTPHSKDTGLAGPIRILEITPVVSKHKGIYKSESPGFLSPSTTVDYLYLNKGLVAIETMEDAAYSAPFVTEVAVWAEAQGYDAVVVKCMLNPALEEAKKAVNIPVLGPRKASFEAALHFGSKPVYVYPTGILVANLHKNKSLTFQRLLEVSRQAVERGADVLIMGCTGIEELALPLREKIDVPVLENVKYALKKAERLIQSQGLKKL